MLQCPFCNNLLSKPLDIKFKTMELTGGICKCRAVYVFDRTGHNLGEIFLDALNFLSRGDIDIALSMKPEEYETVDFDYDLQTNILDSRRRTGRSGRLIFVRLKNN